MSTDVAAGRGVEIFASRAFGDCATRHVTIAVHFDVEGGKSSPLFPQRAGRIRAGAEPFIRSLHRNRAALTAAYFFEVRASSPKRFANSQIAFREFFERYCDFAQSHAPNFSALYPNDQRFVRYRSRFENCDVMLVKSYQKRGAVTSGEVTAPCVRAIGSPIQFRSSACSLPVLVDQKISVDSCTQAQ